jgi:hypothetical protein
MPAALIETIAVSPAWNFGAILGPHFQQVPAICSDAGGGFRSLSLLFVRLRFGGGDPSLSLLDVSS